jgi:transposase
MTTTFAPIPINGCFWHGYTSSFIPTYYYIPFVNTLQEYINIGYTPLTKDLPSDIIRVGKLIGRHNMELREEKGLMIAATSKIDKIPLGYKVRSQSGNGTYVVNLDNGEPFCTCPDFETRHQKCKHIYAVEFSQKREETPDGKVTETKTMKIIYGQNWTAYNDAQTEEKRHFMSLLADLCNDLQQPEQTAGRPRLPLSDMAFASIFKVYTGFSSRRFTSDMVEATKLGYATKTPHFNSVSNYLANPELSMILKSLVTLSSLPLKSVETDFAVDSSGFSTSTYSRYYDHKYGKEHNKQTWIKTHLMCGVKTHIITSVEATLNNYSADNSQFPTLVNQTAKTFTINEVSADKAYTDRRNLNLVNSLGGTAYIPFKKNSTGQGDHHHKFDNLWKQMWHFYNFNQEQFMEHYHKRSNVETTFSMIKAKFGGFVRSKSEIAQINEVLCKVVCHNICVLIQSIHELGIEPIFTKE